MWRVKTICHECNKSIALGAIIMILVYLADFYGNSFESKETVCNWNLFNTPLI